MSRVYGARFWHSTPLTRPELTESDAGGAAGAASADTGAGVGAMDDIVVPHTASVVFSIVGAIVTAWYAQSDAAVGGWIAAAVVAVVSSLSSRMAAAYVGESVAVSVSCLALQYHQRVGDGVLRNVCVVGCRWLWVCCTVYIIRSGTPTGTIRIDIRSFACPCCSPSRPSRAARCRSSGRTCRRSVDGSRHQPQPQARRTPGCGAR
jgi:hypothetical protein